MIEYKPTLGTDIEQACTQALKIAREYNEDVIFDFNGTNVVVTPSSSVDGLVNSWHRDYEENRQKYRDSPEGRRSAADQQSRKLAAQAETDRLVKLIIKNIKDIDTVVKGFVGLSRAICVGTVWNPKSLAKILQEAGYTLNHHVGRKPEDFDNNPQMLKEYIVGQCIDALQMGTPPHQIINKFAMEAGLTP